jgi:hypothetical protein
VDPWEVVEFPAIKDDGEALWPEFWDVNELLAKKAAIDIRYWNAQYMQKPTSEEGALIKREWWKILGIEIPLLNASSQSCRSTRLKRLTPVLTITH